MNRLTRIPVFSWSLGALTVLALILHVPNTQNLDTTVWLFYAALVALMLNLGTRFNEGIVSPALTAALMAYLTLGGDQPAGAALWCVTVGALIGNFIWLVRTRPTGSMRRPYARVMRNITVGIAQMTLGLVAGSWAYRQLGGVLPLDRLGRADIMPLIALVAIYLGVYLGILFFEAYHARRRTPLMVVETWRNGGVWIVVLPLPFAIVGALSYHELSRLAFVMLIGGLLIIVTGVNLLNRTQARYRQQVRELSTLSEISHAMRTSTDLHTLLEVARQQIARLMDVDNFAVALLDATGAGLTFPVNVHYGRSAPLNVRPMENGLTEHVIRERRALLLSDHVARSAAALGLAVPVMPVFSWMGAPLMAPDRVLGAIVVYSTRRDYHFSSQDLQLLSTVAGLVGIAVDNAELYSNAHQRAGQLATLNDVSALLSGSLDAQQVLDLVSASAVEVAGCDGVALFTWSGDSLGVPVLARQRALSDAFATDPVLPLLLSLEGFQQHRQPLIVSDADRDPRADRVRAVMEREGKRAWIEFGLHKGDDLLGVLVFYYTESRSFSPEEIELLRNFTSHAALAINNARLYTRTDEALSRRGEQFFALADISRELTSTLNLNNVFQLVLSRAVESTQSQAGLLLVQLDGDDLPRMVAWRGVEVGDLTSVDVLDGTIAAAYETGQPVLLNGVDDSGATFFSAKGMHAQLSVPIMHNADVQGVIALCSEHTEVYGAEDVSFVTQLATQARIAIDNARLFRRVEIARDRLQVILDSMREGVLLIGMDGQITLANPRIERLLGLNPDQIVGRSIADLLCDQALSLAERLGFGVQALLHIVEELMQGRWDVSSRNGARVTFEVVATRRSFIDRTDAPVRDAGGQVIGLLMVFTDVTEERELAQAREDLSSMIVHDLRGPLTAITTSLKLLGEIAPPDESLGKTITQMTDAALRAVRKLLNLVDSLLDISKLESGAIGVDREPADLRALCESVIDELSPLSDELEISLELEIIEDAPLLEVDKDKIERVLLNLVDNAIKFTPSEGRVVIRARACTPEAGFLCVEVRDTGPGVPDSHKERLFDRFAQLDGMRGRRRGTGLGLTFCRLTIEAHGGQIWIEDNPDGGAIFAFTLPVSRFGRWASDR